MKKTRNYLIIWFLLFGSCFLTLPSFALNNPQQKICQLVENYVLAKNPQWASCSLKVTPRFAEKTFEWLASLPDNVELKIADTYVDFKPVGNVIFPVRVIGEGVDRKIFFRARVEVFKEVVVARQGLKRGQAITPEDVALEDRDIARLPQKYFEDSGGVIGSETKTAVSQGGTIFDWMIKEVPLVRRGDEVAVLVKEADLLVKTLGVALMDGYLNKEIKVKTQKAQKPLEGILISKNEVEVVLK